nr:Chain D, Vang-like protein 1 [Trichoplax sp. H2]8BP4_E Chain E, Vang-like protein 1 [Trichoplax sp. H2]8BP4_F Chain F, Vang-like protein 1 [Trichoplax sp. H2]8BQ8_D Chain D, Vang-like protein 1 [Trichoplax sp. H2]8BQ8_E Chain E, Vang-like protein 1 [Trichoplax sp. H2]8BQ8_F Chain F, Vang-like protein 1 [Trichoplax sp. H2]8BUW_C Chain C, Vang-like protein 1 [Trichoplax sp. H2]8BUW_D Chain D, Vang-like protein 1 [Trichoplax sp. H2]8C1T_E Chain E, Vang-like protein 1 [Trichoplax sp. H2]8C1
NPNPETSV